MKKLVCLLLALLLLSGCGSAAAPTADEAAEALLSQVKFADSLAEIDRGVVAWRYGIAEDVTARVYLGSGATAEEVCVFSSPNEHTAAQVETLLKEHLAAQRESFADYLPAETAKIDNAVLSRRGTLTVLVVSGDPEAAKKTEDILYGKTDAQ